jgi:hypothetical protein
MTASTDPKVEVLVITGPPDAGKRRPPSISPTVSPSPG